MRGRRYPQSEDDAVVIGASTAGLFGAYLLARQGLRVRLFDQHEQLGPPQRTLIVTNQINQILGFTPHEAVVNHIQEIELLSQNRRALVKLGVPDLVLERERLIQLLAERAQREGVEIELGYNFLGLEGSPGGLSLALHNRGTDRVKEIKARALIGADGVWSQVARAAGADDRSTVAIWQAKVILPPETGEHMVRVWFHKESTPFFYWLIPESKRRGVVGLVCTAQEKAEGNLRQFLDAYGFEALDFQAADVPMYHPSLPVSIQLEGSEVFLIGDAGGQVKVTTVGGVVAGLRGARAVVGALFPRPYGQNRQKRRGRKELRRLRRELGLHFLMRSLLDRFSDSDYDHLLDLVSNRTKGVLQTYSRDELGGAFFKLLLAQPRLLPLAARSLMRIGEGKR